MGWAADDERRDAEFIPDAAPRRQAGRRAARCGSNISASCVEKVFVSQTLMWLESSLFVRILFSTAPVHSREK